MSVRMALAKLCACACGGAVIGGGAVHVAEGARPGYAQSYKKRVVRRTVVRRPVTRVRRTVTTTTTGGQCVPQMLTMTSQGAPIPLPPAYGLGSSGEFPVAAGGGGGGGGGSAVAINGGGSVVTLAGGVGTITLDYTGTWASGDTETLTITGGTVLGYTVANKTSVDTLVA